MTQKASFYKANLTPVLGTNASSILFYLILSLVGSSFLCALAEPCPAHCVCSGPFVTAIKNTTNDTVVTKTTTPSPLEKNVVNCSGRGLSKFPPEIDPEVQILDLSLNGINTLPTPRTLSTFKRLEKILLRGNRISSPIHQHTFQGLRSLVLIDLSHNAISTLPNNTFETCKKLETVSLSLNKRIVSIPSIVSDSIKELDLSDCGISNTSGVLLPKSITTLSLKGNPLKILDGSWPILSSTLNTLDVRSSSLKEVHREALSRLPSLVTLRLSNNKGVVSISNVWSDSLRTIDATDCSLGSEVDEDDAPLAGMSHLTRAFLSGNNIKSLGKNSFSTNDLLYQIDLSRNGLKDINTDCMRRIQNLNKVNLSYNALTQINYKLFAKNEHLMELDISYNPHLDPLPAFFASSLIILNASNCGITELGDGENPLLGMPNLKLLELCHNPLEDLPVLASEGLEVLDLAFCRLSVVKSSSLTQLSRLKKLDLTGNRISYLDPNLVKNLNYLAISDNPWECACKDPNFLELWKLVENVEPQAQPLHCAPESDRMGERKLPGEGMKLWSDVCHRSIPVYPSTPTSAVWSVFVALVLTLLGVIVVVVGFRHWMNRKKKEVGRRNAIEAERRLHRLRRRARRSDSDDEEGDDRRVRHRDIVRVTRRVREEPRISEPPPYEEAVLMPRPEEVEVTLVTTPVDQPEPERQGETDGETQTDSRGETTERQREVEGESGEGAAIGEESRRGSV